MGDFASRSAPQQDEEPAAADSVRVVIADDHPAYRRWLAEVVTRSGVEVVGEAANGLGAIEAVAREAPDVVVMDLKMPGISGMEAIRYLTEHDPAIRVLALTVSTDKADVRDALQAGASGYVLKDSSVDDVVGAIRAAAAGASPISPRIAPMLLRQIRDHEEGEAGPRRFLRTPGGGPEAGHRRVVDNEVGTELGTEAGAVTTPRRS